MITIKVEGMEAARKSFDPKIVQRAAKAAVKDATAAAKTETRRSLLDGWKIKSGDLNRRLSVKANMVEAEAVLSISGPPISLSYFGAVQVMGSKRISRGKDGMVKATRARNLGPQPVGVRVQIRPGAWTLLRGAWMRNTRNFAGRAIGGELLFGSQSSARVLERVGGKIIGPKSITIASMFEQVKVSSKVISRASEVLQRRFDHHLDRLSK